MAKVLFKDGIYHKLRFVLSFINFPISQLVFFYDILLKKYFKGGQNNNQN